MPILETIALQAGISGLAGGLSGLFAASEEKRAANKANDRIDRLIEKIDEEREESRREFSNTAESFLTNYALVRDPDRAAQIRATYSQERQRQETREDQLNDLRSRAEASRPTSGSSPIGGFLSGLGIGAASGAASGIGQAIGSGFDVFGSNQGSGNVSGLNLSGQTSGVQLKTPELEFDNSFNLNTLNFDQFENDFDIYP